MKTAKTMSFVLFFLAVLCGLWACGSEQKGQSGVSSGAAASGGGKIRIVTTIFPEYDWVREILGQNQDRAEITMLLDKGVDLHSYQPTAQDIMKIGTCDLFIYVGGESDEWVEDALRESVNKDMRVINLLDVLGDKVKEEEVVEGMQGEEEEEGEEGEETEYDEHIWLSIRRAKIICLEIAEKLKEIDPDNAGQYDKNVKVYSDKLDKLDQEYKSVAEAAPVKTILFGDRFPFRYMTEDYGLDYYAAFAGCSAETEASFETVTFLAKKVDELNLKVILTIEGNDQKIADTIRQNTKEKNQNILTLDSLQSTTMENVQAGKTYLSVMQENLKQLKSALA